MPVPWILRDMINFQMSMFKAIVIFSDTEATLHSFEQATFSHVNIFLKQKNSTQLKPEFFSIHGFLHDFSRFLNMSIWLSVGSQGCNHILTWTFSPSNIWPTTLVLCLGSCELKLYNSPAGRLLGCRVGSAGKWLVNGLQPTYKWGILGL